MYISALLQMCIYLWFIVCWCCWFVFLQEGPSVHGVDEIVLVSCDRLVCVA